VIKLPGGWLFNRFEIIGATVVVIENSLSSLAVHYILPSLVRTFYSCCLCWSMSVETGLGFEMVVVY
jgi:hypothetical protein